MHPLRRLAASTLAGTLLLAPAGLSTTAAAPSQGSGRVDRDAALRGARFDTMRALARYLHDGAEYALAEASRLLGSSRDGNDRAYLGDLRNFARRTADLGNRLYDYQTDPRGLDGRLRSMISDARRIDSRMRRVSGASGLYDDWAAVRDGLDRMQRFAAGYDVPVPVARSQWADRGQDRPYSDRSGRNGQYGNGRWADRTSDSGEFRTGALSGHELGDFRGLAGEVDQRLHRVLDAVQRNSSAGPRNAMISDLRNLAYRASALYDRARGDSLDVRDAGTLVERLLAEARRIDRGGLRDVTTSSDARSDWQGAITVMQRMDDLLRR